MKEHLIKGFHEAIDRSGGEDSCWNWKKSLSAKGYGQTWDGYTVTKAHRVAYELEHKVALTSEIHVLHKCDNRVCCNPKHLFLGDNKTNMDDKMAKGRQSKGVETGNAKLTPEQVLKMRAEYSNVTRRITAKLFGVTPQAVSHILCGTRWKHI